MAVELRHVFVILLVSFGWLAIYNFLMMTVNYVSYRWENRQRQRKIDSRTFQVYYGGGRSIWR